MSLHICLVLCIVTQSFVPYSFAPNRHDLNPYNTSQKVLRYLILISLTKIYGLWPQQNANISNPWSCSSKVKEFFISELRVELEQNMTVINY